MTKQWKQRWTNQRKHHPSIELNGSVSNKHLPLILYPFNYKAMRNTIPSVPWLLVLRSLIIAIGIIARAVKDWKQKCLRQAHINYLEDEAFDEFHYRDNLEDEYHSIKHTEDFVQVPFKDITSSHSQRKHT